MKKIFITLLTLLVLTPVFAVNNITGKWSWANDGYQVWGNAGNSGNGAGFTAMNVDGFWWGVTDAADLTTQLIHADSGVDYGDADNNAYMMFENGKVTTYKADGTVIRSGDFNLNLYSNGRGNNNWELGKLTTSEPALLFPWSINENGTGVINFDVMYYDGVNMTLVYTKGNSSGSWGEITYWRFKNQNMVEINGVKYVNIDDSETAVTSIESGYSGDVTIASSITIKGKSYTVNTIAGGAFKNCTELTSITIPSTITKIAADAFSGCSSLTKVNITDLAAWCKIDFGDNPLKYAHNLYLNGKAVTDLEIPSTVTSVSSNAFYGCTSITSVDIPSSVTSIGDYAFAECTGITSVSIPDELTSVATTAFSGCTSLTMPIYNSTYFIKMPSMCKGKYKIPSGIKYICEEAFLDCTGLTGVTIPSTVETIGSSAFKGCTGLTSIEIPSSVTCINSSTFSGCTGLTSFDIPTSITSIGYYAFYGCTGLTSIEIPSSVTSIEDDAFANCTGLTSASISDETTSLGFDIFGGCTALTMPVFNSTYFIKMPTLCKGKYTIPNGVKYIWYGAFENCEDITSVTIPNTVKSIESYAFYGCSGLTKIEIPNSVTDIGSNAFDKCTSLASVTLSDSLTYINSYCFANCTSLTSITLPNSVYSVWQRAFSGCTSLESVTMGNGVGYLGSYSFYNCKNLKTVTCRTVAPPSIWSDYYTFYNVSLSDATLIVSTETYRTANTWKEFGTIKVEASDLTADITDEDYKIESESYKAGNITYSRDITDGTYITLCLPFSVDISAATGIEHVYLPTGFAVYNTATERVQLYVEELKSTIPGSTPVIIKTTGSDLYVTNSSVAEIPMYLYWTWYSSIKVYDMNPNSSILMKNDDITMSWRGTYEPYEANDYTKSFNSDGSFGTHTGTLSPFRAFIYEENNSSSAKVAGIDIMFGDESTAIKNLQKSESSSNQKVYNLNGQQVGTVQPGKIYIVNGRKVIK